MKKIALLGNSFSAIAIINKICEYYKIPIVDESEADVIMISMCDVDELKMLKQVKKRAKGRPVIMGGFESYFGVPYLAWADAVCVGEGLEFFEAFATGGLDKALALDCVLTMEKYNRGDIITPSYVVPYDFAPLYFFKKNTKVVRYLAEKGCPNKCKFCATSWVQPYSVNKESRIRKAIKFCKDNKLKLNLISNNAGKFTKDCTNIVSSLSVRLKDYIKNPLIYKSCLVRLGIEFWTEKERAAAGKPISNYDLNLALKIAKDFKQVLRLFFLIGYKGFNSDEYMDDFVSQITTDKEKSPRIDIKATYIGYMPHTPYSDIENKLTFFDPQKVYPKILGANRRFFFQIKHRSLAKSAWRTCFLRCSPEEALHLGGVPDIKDVPNGQELLEQHLEKKGLLHLIIKKNECEKVIKTFYSNHKKFLINE